MCSYCENGEVNGSLCKRHYSQYSRKGTISKTWLDASRNYKPKYKDCGTHIEFYIDGKVVLVESLDFLESSPGLPRINNCGYLAIGSHPVHRLIIKAPKGIEVDHINGNKLDNRLENLRLCTHKSNMRNMPLTKRNKSGYKCVTKRFNKYLAYITVDYKVKYVGSYDTAVEAAKAYDEAAVKYFGEYAYTNAKAGLL